MAGRKNTVVGRNSLISGYKVSRKNTLIIVGVIAALGAVFLWRSFAATPSAIPFYRLYKPSTRDYFYTASNNERHAVNAIGYRLQTVAGYIYNSPQTNREPLYRLYNSRNHLHFYTTSNTEKQAAINNGYHYELIAGYLTCSSTTSLMPYWRAYSSLNGSHYYTTYTGVSPIPMDKSPDVGGLLPKDNQTFAGLGPTFLGYLETGPLVTKNCANS